MTGRIQKVVDAMEGCCDHGGIFYTCPQCSAYDGARAILAALDAASTPSAGDDGRAPLRRRVTVSLHEDGESVARWEPSLPAGVNEPDEQTEYVRAVGALMTAQKAYDASCPGPSLEEVADPVSPPSTGKVAAPDAGSGESGSLVRVGSSPTTGSASSSDVGVDLPDEAERIAREFHEVYERLAPRFKWSSQISGSAWEDVPESNKMLMLATVHDLLRRGVMCPSAGDGERVKRVVQRLLDYIMDESGVPAYYGPGSEWAEAQELLDDLGAYDSQPTPERQESERERLARQNEDDDGF